MLIFLRTIIDMYNFASPPNLSYIESATGNKTDGDTINLAREAFESYKF